MNINLKINSQEIENPFQQRMGEKRTNTFFVPPQKKRRLDEIIIHSNQESASRTSLANTKKVTVHTNEIEKSLFTLLPPEMLFSILKHLELADILALKNAYEDLVYPIEDYLSTQPLEELYGLISFNRFYPYIFPSIPEKLNADIQLASVTFGLSTIGANEKRVFQDIKVIFEAFRHAIRTTQVDTSNFNKLMLKIDYLPSEEEFLQSEWDLNVLAKTAQLCLGICFKPNLQGIEMDRTALYSIDRACIFQMPSKIFKIFIRYHSKIGAFEQFNTLTSILKTNPEKRIFETFLQSPVINDFKPENRVNNNTLNLAIKYAAKSFNSENVLKAVLDIGATPLLDTASPKTSTRKVLNTTSKNFRKMFIATTAHDYGQPTSPFYNWWKSLQETD